MNSNSEFHRWRTTVFTLALVAILVAGAVALVNGPVASAIREKTKVVERTVTVVDEVAAQKLVTITAQLEATQKELSTTEAGLSEMKADLSVANSVISTTQAELDAAEDHLAILLAPALEKIPGGSLKEPSSQERPAPWFPSNKADCSWGVPSGTQLGADEGKYLLTNCVSFNLYPPATGFTNTLPVTWTYPSFPVFSQELSQTVTIDLVDFLKWNWDATSPAERYHDGVAVWGPATLDTKTSYVDVVYEYPDGATSECRNVRSFEIVPEEEATVKATFVNRGTIPAVWSQGVWGPLTDKGVYAPECRPTR
ncbi:hypothetical protein A3F07_04380 [candidate division WWE3 bacterium RIFCSPHIGHO2_12_FULL_38_15]|nr:MAG: hypothetical protein A3F07_04380 [candidate division WWE3 bacterium RIFCSPHIGHO2_12_FULL_38_15]